jgi:hypothetical protein
MGQFCGHHSNRCANREPFRRSQHCLHHRSAFGYPQGIIQFPAERPRLYGLNSFSQNSHPSSAFNKEHSQP